MNKTEIMDILPHRDDMLLLDEAHLGEDGAAHGSYTVRGDEFFLHGHFPGNPIMPGVIQCEIIAQTACVLLANEIKGRTPLYAGIDKVRFRRPVRPGDTLETTIRLKRHMANLYVCTGEARVGDELCSSGEFQFAVT